MNTYTVVEKYIQKGVDSYNLGKYASANIYFDKAIEFYEKSKDKKRLALLYNSKGMALEALGSHLENLEGSENSLYCEDTIDPALSDVCALKCFEEAVKSKDTIDPALSDACALKCFEEAVKLSNGIANADIVNIYRNKGYTHAKRKEYARARRCFEKAEDVFHKADDADPIDVADTYRNMGYAIAKENYSPENLNLDTCANAIGCLEDATKRCPEFALAWNTLGYIHTMFEKYDKAQECFAKAINLDPDFAGARRNYGYVLYCNYQM